MARARNLKPSFFTDDEIAGLEPLARILFMGLWCLADREGRLHDKPKKIKAEVLPYDDVPVDNLLQGLHDARFIVRYEHDGQHYIQVRQFKKHQKPHIKELASSIPGPEPNRPQPKPEPVPEIPEPSGLIVDCGLLIPSSGLPLPDCGSRTPDPGLPQPATAADADPPTAANANGHRSKPVEIIPEKPKGKTDPATRVAELAKAVLTRQMSRDEQLAAVAELQRAAAKAT
jgi:hypothetical protein